MIHLISTLSVLVCVIFLVIITECPEKLFRPKVEPELEDKIGDYLKFTFPIIRRVNASLIAQQLVSVQPMTAPVGGLSFYRPRYGSQVHRTVLDDIVDSLIASETDPEQIAEHIVRNAFRDHPLSTYYCPEPKLALEPAAA